MKFIDLHREVLYNFNIDKKINHVLRIQSSYFLHYKIVDKYKYWDLSEMFFVVQFLNNIFNVNDIYVDNFYHMNVKRLSFVNRWNRQINEFCEFFMKIYLIIDKVFNFRKNNSKKTNFDLISSDVIWKLIKNDFLVVLQYIFEKRIEIYCRKIFVAL